MLRIFAWASAFAVTFLGGTVYAQNGSTPHVQVIHIAEISSASIPRAAPGVKVKDVARTPSGDVGVVEIRQVPRHRHNHTDELIYVIRGTATAMLGNRSYTLKPGDLVVLPHGTPHDFKSAAGFRVLGIAYPKDDPKDFDALGH